MKSDLETSALTLEYFMTKMYVHIFAYILTYKTSLIVNKIFMIFNVVYLIIFKVEKYNLKIHTTCKHGFNKCKY